jgi:hypothetical protein
MLNLAAFECLCPMGACSCVYVCTSSTFTPHIQTPSRLLVYTPIPYQFVLTKLATRHHLHFECSP